LLDVIAGYDPHDRITASSVGHIPTSYRASLTSEGLKGARLGIIREPMNPKADPTSDDYKRFRAVTDRAIRDLKLLGAETLDPLTIPDLKDRIRKLYEGNVFETEQAIDNYFVQHANAPVKSLAEILRSGKIVPARATTLRSNLGRSINETGYLKPPAPSRRDAAACAGPHGG
jgi:Asp-tRNA(Asn)/Glu-tRNA(Gln) amidotransferase A subunit family amidase